MRFTWAYPVCKVSNLSTTSSVFDIVKIFYVLIYLQSRIKSHPSTEAEKNISTKRVTDCLHFKMGTSLCFAFGWKFPAV